jgi:hypothetical protein
MWMCGVCWHMKQSQGQLFLGEDNITSNSFLEIWENFAPLQLNNSNNLILLLDTVLLHFVHNVCNSQNVNFQCQWTGREGPIVWPPSFPWSYTFVSSLGLCEGSSVQSANMLDELKAWTNAANLVLQRTCYSASAKRRFAVGCMQNWRWHSLFKCFIPNIFPLACKKTVSNYAQNSANNTLISVFVLKLQVPAIRASVLVDPVWCQSLHTWYPGAQSESRKFLSLRMKKWMLKSRSRNFFLDSISIIQDLHIPWQNITFISMFSNQL